MAFSPPPPSGIKPLVKPAGNPYANIQVAPKVVPKQNLMRPPAPVSPTVYDGIRKVDPTYKNPKVNLIQQMGPSIEQRLASEANGLLVNRYGDPRENKKGNPLFSPHESGSDNALTHAATSMVLANKVGWPLANIAGLGHELMVGLQPGGNLFSKDTLMDLRNNFMGSMASGASTQKEQMDRLNYLYKNGWIQTLNPPSSIKMPNFSVDKFISEQRARMEDKYDEPNAKIMSAKYPQYRNVNADNTAWNALKHSGTAEQMATKNGFVPTVLAGGAHEAFGIARKYYDPRMWGQNPPNQDFGFQEDLKRSLMDMRNNTLGAALGSVPFLTQKQRTAVQDWMLRNGILKVLKGPQYPGIGGRGTIRGK